MNYYLAIDIGASSGRHILACVNGGKIEYEEVHRFENRRILKNNIYCWDINYLFGEIITGLQKCANQNKAPSYIGIDTWGVDYLLLDKDGGLIGNAVSYRNNRFADLPEKFYEIMPEARLYQKTGIQKLSFNTVFQLYDHAKRARHELDNAEDLLFIPCYLSYLLTGVKANEYTVASTSGMLNAESGEWDDEIISRLGLRREMLTEIKPAGSILGSFTKKISDEVGFTATVILPCTHDTGSAVLAAPLKEDAIYISTGTWSLMGIESDCPFTDEKFRLKNFTNEGGYGKKYRVLKNIMGLWMLQSVRRELNNEYDFPALSKLAMENEGFPSKIDVSDERFLAPASMLAEIKAACSDNNMPAPQTIGEVCAVIYRGLADYYGKTARDLEELTGKRFSAVNMVGGGTKDDYLDRLTANACGKTVYAGPVEATALGNIAAQMLASGELGSVEQARELIKKSEAIKEYKPERTRL